MSGLARRPTASAPINLLLCRRALLEADVSLPVVRRFVSKVEEAALGERVVKGVAPDQKLVKVGGGSERGFSALQRPQDGGHLVVKIMDEQLGRLYWTSCMEHGHSRSERGGRGPLAGVQVAPACWRGHC